MTQKMDLNIKSDDTKPYLLLKEGHKDLNSMYGIVYGKDKAEEVARQIVLEYYEQNKEYVTVDIYPIRDLSSMKMKIKYDEGMGVSLHRTKYYKSEKISIEGRME